MYNLETEKKQKHRLLAIAGVMIAIIIILIAGIVVIANSKSSKKTISNGQNTEFSLVETSKPESENKPSGSNSTSTNQNKPETSNSTSTESTGNNSHTTTTEATTTDIPQTGPEDLLPVALLLGMLTTVVTAVVMRKHKR